MVTFPLCREPDARFGVRGPCAVAPQRRGPVPASALHLQADRGRQAGVRYRVKDVHLRTLSGAGCRSEAGRGAAEPSRGCRRGEGANRDDVVKSRARSYSWRRARSESRPPAATSSMNGMTSAGSCARWRSWLNTGEFLEEACKGQQEPQIFLVLPLRISVLKDRPVWSATRRAAFGRRNSPALQPRGTSAHPGLPIRARGRGRETHRPSHGRSSSHESRWPRHCWHSNARGRCVTWPTPPNMFNQSLQLSNSSQSIGSWQAKPAVSERVRVT
jgi:hypothetical protein